MTADDKPLRVVIVDDEDRRGSHWRAVGDRRCHRGGSVHGFDAVKTVAGSTLTSSFSTCRCRSSTDSGARLIGPDVPVVFVTAYDEFALKAFDVHASTIC